MIVVCLRLRLSQTLKLRLGSDVHAAAALGPNQATKPPSSESKTHLLRQPVERRPVGSERDAVRQEGEERLESAGARLDVAEEQLAAAWGAVSIRLFSVGFGLCNDRPKGSQPPRQGRRHPRT